jgi:flagellar basal-body rod modification protein FlgD
MASISALNGLTAGNAAEKKPNDLKDLEADQFLQLMITELTNQDPLNPMDNTQLVEQIGQIRQITATNQLSETLAIVQAGQSLTTASSLIGKQVTALTDQHENITGVVDKVTVEIDEDNDAKRTYRVHVGSHDIDLRNVREVKD